MKNHYGILLKTLSVLLCIAMLMCFLPQSILAEAGEALDGGEELPEYAFTEDDEEETPAYVVGEAIDRRTSNTKTFRMSDGGFVLANYDAPVHFEDENGEWTDYDNTLTYGEARDDEDIAGYETAVSDVKIKFANNSKSNNLLKIQTGEYKISMHLVGAEKSKKAEITNTTEALEGKDIDSATTLTKFSSSVKYENILNNTDLQYILNGGNLKENIIVKERTGEYTYTFDLALEGLVTALAEDGSVLINDDETGEAVFVIPAGYMYDAKGECSNKVYYSIEEKDGVLTLTVVADAEWINAEGRAFPVTVDPTFEAAKSGSDTEDTYVSEANPDPDPNDYYLASKMTVGYQNGYANEVLIQAKTLPAIPEYAVITRSYYKFRVYSVTAGSRTDGIKAIIQAYPITSSWNSSAATWNNKPSYSSDALDYKAFYNGSNYGYIEYDITRLAQDWYTGSENNGIALKASGTTDGYVILYSSDNTTSSSYKPKLVIEYRDTKGLDGRWTFAAQSAGNAGEGYVNGFNGNLVFVHNDFATKGGILPITVSHVFNAANAGEEFKSAMPVGKGWKLSVQETITSATIGNTTWYIYNDSDGTDLYFYYDSAAGNYISEDGLGLTLTFGSGDNRYILTDDYGNRKNFNTSGNITSIIDVNGNKKSFVYSSGKLTRITYTKAGTSTAVDQLMFAYYTNGAIKTITDAADTGDYVTFKYSSTYNGSYATSASAGYLRSITYSKGGGCYYTYSSAGNITGAYDNDTCCAVYYSYTTHSYTGVNNATVTTYKVSQVSESGFDNDIADWPAGQTVRFTYADKKFTARTSGTDDIIGNVDDILTTYIFDNEGREICSYSSDVNDQYVYGTSYDKYSPTVQGSKKNSKITVDSVKGASTFNYVLNGNLESLSNWAGATSGTGYSSSLSSVQKHLGSYSIKFSSTSGGTGYARRYATAYLPTNGTFTFSAYVKVDSLSVSSGGGAYLIFDGAESERITAASSADIQNGWRRISVTKTFSVGGEKTVQLRLANATGTVYFDCVQVEKGDAPSGFNAVQNGHMHLQNSWNGGSIYELDEWRLSYVKKVVGNANSCNYASQTVQLSVPADTTLMLSGWGKAVSAPTGIDDNDKKRTFRIVANVHYTDGSSDDQPADFNADYTDWQYSATAIIPAENDQGVRKSISYIIIYLSYDFNINEAYFDDVCLTVEPAQTYKYDENGHIESAKDALGNTTGATYNNVDLTNLITPVGLSYNYTYNNKHQLLTAVKSENGYTQTATYGYDAYGNTTSAVLSASGVSKTISSSATYSSDGNYLDSVTDQIGGVTTYSRDDTTKLLNYIQNANGNRTAYVYDNRYRTSKIYNDQDSDGTPDTGEEFVQYLYSSLGRLQNINTDSSAYTLEYDAYGNISKIKAGANTLATYTYGSYNGKLKKLTYGNGYYEEYTYDHLDRLISVKYNNVVTYTLTYDANGQIAKCVDAKANVTHTYEYDGLGRLIRAWQTDSNGVKTLAVENLYDQYGRADKSTYVVGNKTLSYDVSYKTDTNLVSGVSMPTTAVGSAISYTYDGLDRLTKKNISFSTLHDIYEEYSYYGYTSGGVQYTTPLVSSLTLKKDSTTTATYSYTYDSLGNILTVSKNGSLIYAYEYDSLNQLTREDDVAQGTSTLFDYDLSGNITARYIFPYWAGCPTSQLGTLIGIDQYCTTVSYGYSTGAWGDLLTAYDGTTISYDAIGNPTNWSNSTLDVQYMVWSGRQLTALTRDMFYHTLSFDYNADGVRIKKSNSDYVDEQWVNDTYNYVLDGSKIIKETIEHKVNSTITGTDVLYYYYDAAGSIAGFEYNGTPYYYQKNLQGDIIRICNALGNTVVEYTYDAWGKVLSVTGTLASTVGQINPFRYRGYYYDRETGFYYLQTRYYDPEVGRFLNADGIIGANGDIQGYNLFAYCSNRPTIAADHSGEFIGLIFFAVAVVCTVVVVVDVASSYPNRKSNKKHNVEQAKNLPSGFIEKQGTLNNYKIGWGTIDKNGCGCVAVYNAMILLGDPTPLPDVIEFYDRFYRNIVFAFLGISPFSISSYFDDKGYEVTTGHLNEIDETAKKHRASIILYIHSSGMHYVAFSYDEKIQKFVFHNPEKKCDSIDEFLGDNTVFQVWYIK